MLQRPISRLVAGGVAAALTVLLQGCEPPERVRLVVFLDASGSSVGLRPKMREFIDDFVGRLDPNRDKLVVYQLANRTNQIYVGEARRGPVLTSNLEAYVKAPAATGTSYGLALERAAKEAAIANAEKNIPVIVFLGDAADEPGPGVVNIDPKKIPGIVKKLGPKAIVSFQFVTPTERFSHVYESFQDAFGTSYEKRLQFTTPESEEKHTGRKFLTNVLRR